MNDTRKYDDSANAAAPDPLAELIRAAGHRPEPLPEHYASVRAASHAAWQAKVRSHKRRRWYALAASLLVVSGALAVFQTFQGPERAPLASLALAGGDVALFSSATGAWQPLSAGPAQVFRGDRLRTGADGRAAFAMPNGGSLRIGADTELRLDAGDAVELVSGLLYVDSGERPGARSIAVATRLGVVHDIGTQFEVMSTAQSLRVRVRTGSIELVDSPVTTDFLRGAGQELELSAAGAVQLREIAPDDEQWAWATALAVPDMSNQSILGYLQWIARETGTSLQFDTPNTELQAQFVSWNGDPSGLTPLQVLAAIEETSDFVFESSQAGAILIRRK